MLVVDVSNIDRLSDVDQKEYFKNFIVPVGSKMISDRLKINSTGTLPVFGNYADFCDDNGGLIIPNKYRTDAIDADFVLFVGGFTESTSTIAYASFCLSCKFLILYKFKLKFWDLSNFEITIK